MCPAALFERFELLERALQPRGRQVDGLRGVQLVLERVDRSLESRVRVLKRGNIRAERLDGLREGGGLVAMEEKRLTLWEPKRAAREKLGDNVAVYNDPLAKRHISRQNATKRESSSTESECTGVC